MRKIRRNVFETNSSSSHSVTIGNHTCEDSYLEIEEYCDKGDYEPTIIIDTEGFCGFADHDTQQEKLAYLMQQIAYINGFSDIFWNSENLEEQLEDYYDCDDFRELEEEICDYTGAKHLRFGNLDGYIDHDSVVYDIYELKDEIGGDYCNFVFSSDSYVHFEFNG